MTTTTTATADDDIKAVALRRPGQWAAAVAVLFYLGFIFHSIAMNQRIHWDVIGQYMFAPTIMRGLVLTGLLSVVCMAMGIIVGLISALMRLSSNPVLKWVSIAYIWIFRGTPVLVQLIFWYNIALLFPTISIGIPFGPTAASVSSNVAVTPMVAAICGLTFAEGAYMSEIIRGGVSSVDKGQLEAAQALGMTRASTLRKVILPQAMRVIVPPTGNEFITMIKGTALVAVISVHELLFQAQSIYNANYEVIALLVVFFFFYMVIT